MQRIYMMNLRSGIQSIAAKTFLHVALVSLSILSVVTPAHAQSGAVSTGKLLPDGYIQLPDGLEYKIITHGDGKRKPVLTDHIELHISYAVGDSVMFDSRKMNNNKCVPVAMVNPRGIGDPVVVFSQMVAGDSAVARFPVDTLKKMGQSSPWTKPGDMVVYRIKLVSVKTEAEFNRDEAVKAAVQTDKEAKVLEAYFKEKGLKPAKTASGLYYSITKEGSGEKIKAGQLVGVNYTGKFLDGKVFDSNTDTAFHHVQTFSLPVGAGKVIKGWDEGLQLLKTGSKATFYIPSALAYGPNERPGLPANSILVFDVELIDVPDYSKIDDKIIKDYLTKNNIQATKTPSGLYYVITQNGFGENAKPGKKVTMNYTGQTLDGKVFDSNIDPHFGHVQPFSFTLGMGQVIRGWDEGVQLLKLGSKALFFIPSGLAYGEQGAGAGIPPKTVLSFDVELLKIDN